MIYCMISTALKSQSQTNIKLILILKMIIINMIDESIQLSAAHSL